MSLDLSRFSSLAILLFVATAACGGGGGGGGGDDDDDGTSDLCLEAVDHSDIGWIEDNIFARSCTISGSCHVGAASSAQMLNLEPGNAEENLVGVPAKGEFAEGLSLVAPAEPDNSYLLVILGHFGEDDPRLPEDGNGNKITMPDNSPLLCQEKRDAIERWIEDL
jgi:hypothetical protein